MFLVFDLAPPVSIRHAGTQQLGYGWRFLNSESEVCERQLVMQRSVDNREIKI